MAKTFEEFWHEIGLMNIKETCRAAWDARQEEIDLLTDRLRPFLEAEFLEKRLRFIIQKLYPLRGSNQDFKYPEMTWCYNQYSQIESIDTDFAYSKEKPGLLGISWIMWTTDHTVPETTWIPVEWVSVDNQISEVDLLPIIKQWCEDTAKAIAILNEEKAILNEEKVRQAKIDQVKYLEAELAKAKEAL